METTFKRVFEFQKASYAFLDVNKADTKLTGAIRDVLEQLEPVNNQYTKAVNKIKRNNAAEDGYGCIMRDESGNYKYKKEQEEAMENQIEDLNNLKQGFDIDPCLIDAIPKGLDKIYFKKFVGFVFTHDTPIEEN